MAIDWSIQIHDSLESTQLLAKDAADSGAREGSVFQALEQMSGHGRHGREWVSPAGNLYFSYIVQPQKMLCEFSQIALVAGVALADTIESLTPYKPVLKWPNDVLIQDKKCAGILIDVVGPRLVIGVGVNIAKAPDDAFALGGVDIDVFRDRFLNVFTQQYQGWLNHGFDKTRNDWLAKSFDVGAQVSVKNNADIIQGAYQGLDLSGNLMIETSAGEMKTVSSGDVHFGEKG